jgi:hypothetical protein
LRIGHGDLFLEEVYSRAASLEGLYENSWGNATPQDGADDLSTAVLDNLIR